MSQNPFADHNPYAVAVPQMPVGNMYVDPQAGKPKYPVFVLVIMIIDLVFLAFRGLLVAAGFYGMTSADAALLPPNHYVTVTGWYEVGFGALLFLAGLLADIGILFKQRWGLTIALIKICGFLGSMFVAFWQLSYIMQQFPPGTPQFIGAMIGAGIAMTFRTVLTVLYIVALFKFNKWLQQMETYRTSRGQ